MRSTAFLYEGPNAQQVGVAPGTIKRSRTAVLRGRILTVGGQGIEAVSVRVVGWPEYGFTRTGTDGVFSLVVNGGEPLTLEFAAEGYLPVRRTEHARPVDYTWYPDVVMTALDSARTVVHLSSLSTVQTAIASPTSDASGERQSILLFFPGTQATLMNENGTTESLSTLTVHSTEYTVGEQGPKAMPAPLPPSSGYTYAVEFTAEEAMATNVKQLTFSQPVINYVDNFLRFPVGTPVPSGYFDRAAGGWVPAPNGLIIKMLDSVGGLAEIDADGDDLPDSADSLAAMGIGDDERTTLATLYISGQSLWRVPVSHFSPWDFNWPIAPPLDTVFPPDLDPKPENDNDPDTCQQTGSIVDCHNQVLGQRVDIVGTPFSLTYTSSRAPSFVGTARANIPLSGTIFPPDLKRIDLAVEVAGQEIHQTFPPLPDQTTHFDWDGRDAFGREMTGPQPALITVKYVYDGAFGVPSSTLQQVFGAFTPFPGLPIDSDVRRVVELTFARRWAIPLEHSNAAAQEGFGGWALDVHRVYDPRTSRLTRGDGLISSAKSADAVQTFPEFGHWSFQPAPDGSLYLSSIFVNGAGPNLLKLTPDGTSRVVAAGVQPTYLALDGKRVLFARQLPLHPNELSSIGQIEILKEDGTVSLLAGRQSCPEFGPASGDEGPAIDACLGFITDLDLAPDGQIYVTAQDESDGLASVRRIDGAGTIHSVLDPNIIQGYNVSDLAIAPDYSIYVLTTSRFDRSATIKALRSDGTLSLVAGVEGSPQDCFEDDGSNGVRDHLCGGAALSVASDGTIYARSTIRLNSPSFPGQPIDRWAVVTVRPDGRLAELFTGLQVNVSMFKLAADGGIVAYARRPAVNPTNPFLYWGSYAFYSLRSALPGISDTGYQIPSEDGREVFSFDDQGRQLATYDGLTAATKYLFSYDSNGRVNGVTDTDGRITSIQREGSGHPTAIVSPTGQTTTLTLDSNGYLSTVTSPGGAQHQFEYSGGLLVHEVDARGGVHQFTYDANGRLIEDRDPIGGGWTISKGAGGTVAMASGEGRTRVYAAFDALGAQGTVGPELLGNRQRSVTTPNGLVVTSQMDSQGSGSVLLPDGTSIQTTLAPDPRFGMAAPLLATKTVTTPGGLTYLATSTRSVTLGTGGHLGVASQTDTTVVNGNASTTTYDGASRTSTITSPVGRKTTVGFDTHGRTVFVQRGVLAPANFVYDQNGRLTSVSLGTGAAARVATLAYDTSDRPIVMTDPLSRSSSLGYDTDGRATSQIAPGGAEAMFSYDAAGDLMSLTPPGQQSHQFTYTLMGDEATYLAPLVGTASSLTTYSYNLDRQRTAITNPDGTAISLEYDSAGRLTVRTSPLGSTAYTYSPTTGRLARVAASDGNTLDYSYDGSLPVATTWGGSIAGTLNRTFDMNFRVSSEAVNFDIPVSFNYDGDGLLIGAGDLAVARDPATGLVTGTTLGGASEGRLYNAFGELTDLESTYESTSLLSEHYTRDSRGRIVQEVETTAGIEKTRAFSYDLAGRLWQVAKDGEVTATYLYDGNGNRRSKATSLGTEVGTYDSQDRLVTYGGGTYSYTANGEVRTKTDTSTGGVTTYQYDSAGNLRRVDLPDSRVVEYVVDPSNRRVGKKVNGALVKGWLYSDDRTIAAEIDGNGTVNARIVRGNYVTRDGVTYRIVHDHLRSARLVVDVATGNIVQRLDYDEYGRVILDSNPGFQPFGFAGGLYDADTGLVRFGARDYDPLVGRWTNKDPSRFGIDSGTNLFEYSAGDPIDRTDGNGLWNMDDPRADEWGHTAGQIASAVGDFVEAYLDMLKANAKNSDKYFHCRANCTATERGPDGQAAAELISELREVLDENLKGDSRLQCDLDRAADRAGEIGAAYNASCQQACEPFRPSWLPPQY